MQIEPQSSPELGKSQLNSHLTLPYPVFQSSQAASTRHGDSTASKRVCLPKENSADQQQATDV
ncbi:hypothetical protein OUZ56_030581 [Daphnia magna]|uniref:Uncharacterized protein n=1 Tax=Daphnia magna TaxID=35525 RepID=A0ABQ9ZRQ8_9CRUS|nr:hypothetical protein OUZ56_030577 [Daphnia magna]KAK4015606.1 hypothetical protein OUZ56_030581 [Daphnia magna]